MKIGILTIHGVYNYGAMLQAYALQEYLEIDHNDVEIIDYRPRAIYAPYELDLNFWIPPFKRTLRSVYEHILRFHKFSRFKKFRNNDLNLSKIIYRELNSSTTFDYDLIITGSDQIWNPEITNYDDTFFLPFWCGKKIAYSSSFGSSNINNEWLDTAGHYLNSFEAVGVREKYSLNSLKERNINALMDAVLDPVFLLNKDYWDSFSNVHMELPREYVLYYSLEDNEDLLNAAKTISEEHAIPIIGIHPFKSSIYGVDISINNIGPKEFVNLIKNSKMVVTNSFHGVAFSIVYTKKLYCVPHSKTGLRIKDMLDRLSLSGELFNEFSQNFYDLEKLNQNMLLTEISKSKRFLEHHLK